MSATSQHLRENNETMCREDFMLELKKAEVRMDNISKDSMTRRLILEKQIESLQSDMEEHLFFQELGQTDENDLQSFQEYQQSIKLKAFESTGAAMAKLEEINSKLKIDIQLLQERSKIEQLQLELSEVKEKDLHYRSFSLEHMMSLYHQRFSSLELEITQLEKGNKILREELAEANSELLGAMNMVASLNHHVKALEGNLDGQETKQMYKPHFLSKDLGDANTTKSVAKDLRASLAAFETNLMITKANHSTEIEGLRKTLLQAEEKINTISESIDFVESSASLKVEELTKSIADLATANMRTVNKLEDCLEDSKLQILALEKSLDSEKVEKGKFIEFCELSKLLQNELNSTKEEMASCYQAIAERDQTITELKLLVANKEEELHNISMTIQKNKHTSGESEMEFLNTESLITKQKLDIENAEDLLRTKDAEISSLMHQLTNLSLSVEELTVTLVSLQQKVSAQEAVSSALQHENGKLKEKLMKKQGDQMEEVVLEKDMLSDKDYNNEKKNLKGELKEKLLEIDSTIHSVSNALCTSNLVCGEVMAIANPLVKSESVKLSLSENSIEIIKADSSIDMYNSVLASNVALQPPLEKSQFIQFMRDKQENPNSAVVDLDLTIPEVCNDASVIKEEKEQMGGTNACDGMQNEQLSCLKFKIESAEKLAHKLQSMLDLENSQNEANRPFSGDTKISDDFLQDLRSKIEMARQIANENGLIADDAQLRNISHVKKLESSLVEALLAIQELLQEISKVTEEEKKNESLLQSLKLLFVEMERSYRIKLEDEISKHNRTMEELVSLSKARENAALFVSRELDYLRKQLLDADGNRDKMRNAEKAMIMRYAVIEKKYFAIEQDLNDKRRESLEWKTAAKRSISEKEDLEKYLDFLQSKLQVAYHLLPKDSKGIRATRDTLHYLVDHVLKSLHKKEKQLKKVSALLEKSQSHVADLEALSGANTDIIQSLKALICDEEKDMKYLNMSFVHLQEQFKNLSLNYDACKESLEHYKVQVKELNEETNELNNKLSFLKAMGVKVDCAPTIRKRIGLQPSLSEKSQQFYHQKGDRRNTSHKPKPNGCVENSEDLAESETFKNTFDDPDGPAFETSQETSTAPRSARYLETMRPVSAELAIPFSDQARKNWEALKKEKDADAYTNIKENCPKRKVFLDDEFAPPMREKKSYAVFSSGAAL